MKHHLILIFCILERVAVEPAVIVDTRIAPSVNRQYQSVTLTITEMFHRANAYSDGAAVSDTQSMPTALSADFNSLIPCLPVLGAT